MRYICQFFASIVMLVAVLFVSANAQLTSVTQLKDIKTTDKYYVALKSLIERYGVVKPFSDNTFRGAQPLTREQLVVLLSNSLDRLSEIDQLTNLSDESDDADVGIFDLINVSYDPNKTNITSVSQIKDVQPTAEYYFALQSLVERYGINISDADKNFRPAKTVTEKEFYNLIAGIFGATVTGTQSATKPISRGDSVIVFNDALDSVSAGINAKAAARAEKTKTRIVQSLPSKGRAQIIKDNKFYLPGSGCPDLSAADDNLRIYAADNKWGDYRIKKGDVGDIVYETRNTCSKGGKIVMLRVGTAIVTMMEEGIKRIK